MNYSYTAIETGANQTMGSLETLGRWLAVIGITLAVIGGLVWLVGRFLGRTELPGTLRIDFPGGSCLIPILASIVLSVLLTIVLNVIARLLNR